MDPISSTEWDITDTMDTMDISSTDCYITDNTMDTMDISSTDWDITDTMDPISSTEFDITDTLDTLDPISSTEFDISDTLDPISSTEFDISDTLDTLDSISSTEFDISDTLDTFYPISSTDDGGAVTCPENNPCDIDCDQGCNQLTIYAETSTSLSVRCSVACDDMTIYCPTDGRNGPDNQCQLTTSKDIRDLTVYAQESFYDFQLIQQQQAVLGIPKLLGSPIIHCGLTN